MSAGPCFIIIWEDDIEKEGRLYADKLMQVFFVTACAVYKLSALLFEYMRFLCTYALREMRVYFGLHLALQYIVDHLHLRVIVQFHHLSLRQVVNGHPKRLIQQYVANTNAIQRLILA